MSIVKRKEIEKTLEELNKAYGKGTIGSFGDIGDKDVECTTTGSLLLDRTIRLDSGGFPRGKFTEVYGPEGSGKTTLVLHAIREAQSRGELCAFLDVEQSYPYHFAEQIGINHEELVFVQPDGAEQALDIMESLVKTGEFAIIALDSIAALLPHRELENDIGENAIGVRAKLMSQACRKFPPLFRRYNTAGIWINQIREKIGVMFGCFPYTAKVRLADGSKRSIGHIVNKREKVEVLSWNEDKKILEPKKVTRWYENGRYKNLKVVKFISPHKSGVSHLTVADDHIFITKEGNKKLSELSVGHSILTPSTHYLTQVQYSVVVGSYLGDGSIRTNNNLTYRFRETHSPKQNDYCKWKASTLGSFVSSQGVDKRGRFWFECHPTTELSELSTCKSKGLTCITDHVIDKLDLIALSIWYLDDGTFGGSYKKWGRGKSTIYCKNLPLVEKIKIAKAIKDKFKLDCSVVKSGLIFSGENNYKFHSTIAPFVPKCMEYKIHPKLRQLCGGFDYSDNYDVRDVLIEVPILEIRDGKPKRSPFKYDIEVEHNHNYFVSDVLVHNSPETTPGGNAMKFTASLRIDVRKGPVMKNGDSIIGHVMRATIKKSKISASFGRKVEIPLYYGVGFDYTRELLEVAVGLGIAEKKGSWYNYGNVKLGQGIENAKQFLEDNMEVYEQIESKVKEEAEE